MLNNQHQLYGQTLANTAAREALEATFHGDLVSMRAIMENSANQAHVLLASIHSVDNKLLVQAGTGTQFLPEDAPNYEATITLHDSLAGFVTVTLEPLHWASNRYVVGLFSLLGLSVFIFIGCLVRDKNVSIQLRAKPSSEAFPSLSTDIEDTRENNTAESTHTDAAPAYVALCVKNISVLQQQLNGKMLRATLAELSRVMENIGHLYGARNCHWLGDRYLITFQAGSQADALFNAACSARLMLDLAGIVNRVPLDLAAQLSLSEQALREINMPFVGLAIDTNAAGCEELAEKVEYLEIGDENPERKLIADFVAPYKALLQKQMHQIRAA